MRTLRRILPLVAAILLATTASATARDLSKAGKRSLRYLKAVRDSIRKYHIEGNKHSLDEYTQAAWESMIRYLEAKQIKSMDEKTANVLIEALKRAKMKELERLVSLLDRFAERVGGEINIEELADIGAKGMFLPLQDPFSHLLGMSRLRMLMSAMTKPEDKTLGVNPTRTPEKVWKIAHVRGGYPADDAGLRIGDVLVAINGTPIHEIPPTEVMAKLSAEKGEEVKLTIQREGWAKPHTFTLVQTVTKRQNVTHTMLPGKIGYIRAQIFNMSLAKDVEKALVALEKEGMKALILDLRGNPGGALPACVSVADKFLKGGKEISTMDSKHPFMGGRQVYRAKDKGTHPHVPMAVLINKASASASEMLSGSLKANKRAVVIGQTSFGKGVGQSVVPLLSRLSIHKEQQVLYITLMEYYLPGGIEVQHIGVKPDIHIPLPEPGSDLTEKVWALRESGVLAAYAEKAVKGHRTFFDKAIGFSRFDIGNFPGVVEAFHAVDPSLPPRVFKKELWRAVRLALEKTRGRSVVVKPNEDPELRRAVLEMCKALDLNPERISEYKGVIAPRRGGRRR